MGVLGIQQGFGDGGKQIIIEFIKIIRAFVTHAFTLQVGFNFRDDIIFKIKCVVFIGTVDIKQIIFGRFFEWGQGGVGDSAAKSKRGLSVGA